MKKILYSSLFALFAIFSANAQCTPDPQFTSVGFHPDSITGLPIACESAAYNETITIISPVDTVLAGFTIAVDSVHISNVSGLPTGLVADCQNPNCSWLPVINPASCLSINGTPGVGTAGTYPLVITYDVYVTILGNVQSFPFAQGYQFEVQGCAGLEELNPKNKELVKITDLMGREILPQPGMPVLYHYSDGTVQKIVRLEE